MKGIIMQKLEKRRLPNTPTNASQVRSNCGLSLNKEETLSVTDLKTFSNNPEVNNTNVQVDLKSFVYILSITGKPLMPCSKTKARKLLKHKRATIVNYYPFTIQLTFQCEEKVQPVKLGIDSGYKTIGFSCITENKEVVSGELELDEKTSKRLTERAMYRKLKRNKLWYRKPRFLNRKKKKGWLAPSVQRRYNTHLKIINLCKKILPITEVTIETGMFDISKVNEDDCCKENMRNYLFAREKGLCQICKKPLTGHKTHIHHCKERCRGGTNRSANLAIVHKTCHERFHDKGLKLSSPREHKSETFMNILNKRIKEDVLDIKITFGYLTSEKRKELNLEKSHHNDAFVIAGGSNQIRCVTTVRHKDIKVNKRI